MLGPGKVVSNLFQNVTDLTENYFQEIFVEIAFYDRQYTDIVIKPTNAAHAFSAH